ncbi:hypothetical protein GpartN1_g6371.t1 [Galdieria partita]|uniref:Reactive oxygen species modulator 1 n=2 Tax=Galdieria TaxID=83373 RepID=A0A9C7Q2A7_9RHOD|nr:hypothetical protein GAYE_PCTG30G0735 [Galdieria yellowstonensis]KAK4526295.1 hypothetical protein GAYE_SCF22MG4209 [Galdieria yellowstonensis]GJQ12755.1 hypothetical protein GpartN1_g4546.t1 [Galdieria partita]GJQ14580.1 hypothetical protein GpartN1_g6371.t1 [Galdieria partita]
MSPETRDCMRKIQMGALLGSMVGGSFGLLYGGFEAFRHKGLTGPQRIGLALRSTVGAGIAFGFFLAVGTGIRGCGAHERY